MKAPSPEDLGPVGGASQLGPCPPTGEPATRQKGLKSSLSGPSRLGTRREGSPQELEFKAHGKRQRWGPLARPPLSEGTHQERWPHLAGVLLGGVTACPPSSWVPGLGGEGRGR